MPQDLTGPRAPARRSCPGQPAGSCGRSFQALRHLAVAGLVLLAAACSSRSELGFTTLLSEVEPAKAILIPPPGGPAIVAVLQRKFDNGISQEIALSTASLVPGQNAFYGSLVDGSASQATGGAILSPGGIAPEEIQKEMEERLPGVEMQTSLAYVQNKYGPFGFAVGRAGTGDLCLYAWQRIAPEEPAIFMAAGSISVRLRLCDADATLEQLLRVMYGYTISGFLSSVSWNPYGAPPPPPAELGGIGAPHYPFNLDGMTIGPRREADRTVPALRTRSSRTPVVDKDTVMDPAPPAPPRGPLDGYPVVPPPPSQF